MMCFARLVRALLGVTALAAKKLACGPSLLLLGVQVSFTRQGYTCRPDPNKVAKWVIFIKETLHKGVLRPGCARKLAGRLSWAAQHLFRKVGRCMLRPIFAQGAVHHGRIGPELRIALCWWLAILKRDIVETRRWCEAPSRPMHLFVDARGYPPRCAAILFTCDGQVLWTDGRPSGDVLARFQDRGDNQIMSLEVLAIALGLSTFINELAGHKVVIYSDNVGAEHSCRKGTAKCWDHASMIHGIWSMALFAKMSLWIERVPSEENLADLPSREAYELVADRLEATWHPPSLAQLFRDESHELSTHSLIKLCSDHDRESE